MLHIIIQIHSSIMKVTIWIFVELLTFVLFAVAKNPSANSRGIDFVTYFHQGTDFI